MAEHPVSPSPPALLERLKPSTRNVTAAATSLLLPLPIPEGRSAAVGWSHALHLCATEQSPAGAWGLAIVGLLAAAILDRARRLWLTRALLFAAAIGMLLTPPAVRGTILWITGV